MYAAEQGMHGMINLPAILILFLLSMLLIRGTAESAAVNNVIVIVKVAIVLLIIGLGWQFINPANHTPYMIPSNKGIVHTSTGIVNYADTFNHGWLGVLRGASVVFFRIYRFRCRINGRTGSKKPAARYAKRDIDITGVLYCALYFIFACAYRPCTLH